ncbi:MAG: type III-B CRISPR module RAMP protein Cmr6, partial [Isosphaeraceae bacterium]
MPIGKVEFWNPARREGALLTESNERFRFTAGALAGLDPSEVHRGLELEFEVMSGGDAGRVRKREALFLTLKEDLPVDHRCFRVVPCPDRTRTLVESMLEREGVNPGLRLDKYLVPAPRQEQQKERLGDFVRRAGGDVSLFSELAGRRRAMLQSLATRAWTRETAGSLALHLARASALENAGICLHPIHGFAYLPGTGLKGLARAFAETVWLPLQAHETARQEIDRVFGQAGHETAASGTVVFHDAWPTTWPRLIVDLVNNHHKKYYEGKDAPGDWESPEMAYFLAVDKGQEFSFALGERREGTAAR